jgi:hypothetical protein
MGFVVETSQWRRLQRRIEAAGREPSPTWLVSLATSCMGVAFSALTAVVVIPTSGDARLGTAVRPALWAIFGSAALIGLVLISVYQWLRRRMPRIPEDICDEMRTIEAAWLETTASVSSESSAAREEGSERPWRAG